VNSISPLSPSAELEKNCARKIVIVEMNEAQNLKQFCLFCKIRNGREILLLMIFLVPTGELQRLEQLGIEAARKAREKMLRETDSK
jgi:hypothetical protein